MVIIFLGLLGGAAITSSGSMLPFLEQVNNPEASTGVGTGNQYQLLAFAVVVVLGSLGGIATALSALLYHANRQVTMVNAIQVENTASMSAEAQIESSPDPFTRQLRENPVMTVAGIAMVMTALLFVVALFSGILF